MEGILGKLGQTWPVKLAESIYGAFALPGQVASGVLNVPPSQPGMWSDMDEAKSQATRGTMMNRAADLGGLVMGGSYGMAPAGAVGSSGGRLIVRQKGQQIGSDDLAGMTRPGHVYRGMSEAEYQATIGSGAGIKSNLSSSIKSAEGTNFAADLPTAESYANYGRTDPRITGKPNYIVEVTQGGDILPKRDGYLHALGEVPADRITRVWRMEDDGGSIAADLILGKK
jgi:hypothetical protein